MKTIGVVSRKGGSGKTTLTVHLAIQAARAGAGPVAVVDADPMGGAAGWFNVRHDDLLTFLNAEKLGLKDTLAAAERSGIALVLIDTPPAATDGVRLILECCDLAIVPVVPSANDLRAVVETLELVEKTDRPLLFVLNSARANAKLTGQASRVLSQHGAVAKVVVATREDYRSAMTDGRTAVEIRPNGLAAKEIAELWAEVAAKLNLGRARRGKASG